MRNRHISYIYVCHIQLMYIREHCLIGFIEVSDVEKDLKSRQNGTLLSFPLSMVESHDTFP